METGVIANLMKSEQVVVQTANRLWHLVLNWWTAVFFYFQCRLTNNHWVLLITWFLI